MTDGITVRILGDFGPFSRMGKSIGYQINIGHSSYLLDCGSPLFQQIGGHGLKKIKGLMVTHCHDDHKRWFTDLALFNMYVPDVTHKIFLLTSENVHKDLIRASGSALDRSLNVDSKKVVDIPFEDYVNHQVIGPKAKYKIVAVDEGEGKTALRIMDTKGNTVGPDVAKIVIGPETRRPRMLFKDPDYGEWVEPECFYPFSSDVFYEKDKNVFKDTEGFTIEAIKAPVWHGISAIGLKIKTNEETLIFSSDTVNDLELWKALCTEKRPQRLNMPAKEFGSASVIYGDINDYIERMWSEERYREAVNAYKDGIVIHDISIWGASVHTEYQKLNKTLLEKERVILTHSPDKIVSEWVLCDTEKIFKIKGDKFFEMAGDKPYPLNADIYYKEAGRYWVGYKNEKGKHTVYEKNGILSLSKEENAEHGTPLYKVDMYEDISGKYYPKLENKDSMYLTRRDGTVELLEFTEKGSKGKLADNQRNKLLMK